MSRSSGRLTLRGLQGGKRVKCSAQRYLPATYLGPRCYHETYLPTPSSPHNTDTSKRRTHKRDAPDVGLPFNMQKKYPDHLRACGLGP